MLGAPSECLLDGKKIFCNVLPMAFQALKIVGKEGDFEAKNEDQLFFKNGATQSANKDSDLFSSLANKYQSYKSLHDCN
jgi:hypothetical protein